MVSRLPSDASAPIWWALPDRTITNRAGGDPRRERSENIRGRHTESTGVRTNDTMPGTDTPAFAGDLPTSETIRLLPDRVSVRRYTDHPDAHAHVEAILRAAFRAPTAATLQSYTWVLVRGPETPAGP